MKFNAKIAAAILGKVTLGLILIFIFIVLFGALEINVFFNQRKNESKLREFSKTFDASHLKDDQSSWLRSSSNDQGYQHGLLELQDYTTIKFWFVSHHSAGRSFTIFEFPDGERAEMRDRFCCEVYFEKQPENKAALLEYIKSNEGIKPYDPGFF